MEVGHLIAMFEAEHQKRQLTFEINNLRNLNTNLHSLVCRLTWNLYHRRCDVSVSCNDTTSEPLRLRSFELRQLFDAMVSKTEHALSLFMQFLTVKG